MGSIFGIGKDIAINLRKSGDKKLLSDLFKIRTESYHYKKMCLDGMEYNIGSKGYLFADLNTTWKEVCVFDVIPSAISILLNQNDTYKFSTALTLLHFLVKLSNTTQIPLSLEEKKTELENRILETGNAIDLKTWKAIQEWYRI